MKQTVKGHKYPVIAMIDSVTSESSVRSMVNKS